MLRDFVAPWIVEAWKEALNALVVRMPLLPLEPGQMEAIVAGSALALLLFALLAARELHPDVRGLAQLFMAAVLLVPVVDVAAHAYGSEIEAGIARLVAAAQPTRGAGRRVAAAPPAEAVTGPEPREPAPVPDAPRALPQQAPLPEAAPPLSAGGSARVAVVEPVAPAPAVAVTEQPSAAEAAAATIKRVSSYMARTMMRRGEGPVTVLYGTDRAVDKAALPLRSGEPPRLDYSAERAGTLTFGRAQVAVSRAGEADGTSSGALEVSEIKPLEHDELLVAAVKQLALARKNKDHALVFVHGFNTTFDTALYRAAGIAHELKFDGPVFIYSWPSAGHVVRYAYDTESAAGAKPFLGGFLKLVMGETGASSVTIIAQGLGAAPVMEALAAIKGELPAGAAVSDVILAAPDLDRETFATRVRNLAGVAGRVTLYAAASDRALNISRRYAGAVPRAGDVPDGGPMVLAGVETVDITEAGIGAIGQAIAARGSAQPGTPRPEYEAVATPKGAYWRYIKATRQR